MAYNIPRPRSTLTGYQLARNGFSKSQRAALAASIILGELELCKLTKKQLAGIFRVSCIYIDRTLALQPDEREAMCNGRGNIANLPPDARTLERLVQRAGVETVWNALVKHL